MALLSEASEDLRTAPMQRRTYQDDPRGATYGRRWVDTGAPVPCAYVEMSTTERFRAGRQESMRMLKVFADLTTNGESPVDERERVTIAGREYDVTSVRTIVAEGDEGAVLEVVSSREGGV